MTSQNQPAAPSQDSATPTAEPLRDAPTPTSSVSAAPDKRPRWLYARGKGWATFAVEDDKALEERWQQLGGAQWAESLEAAQGDDEDDEDGTQRQGQGDGQGDDAAEQPKAKRRQRPPMPTAPPSGVDAVRSAISGVTDLPGKAKRTIKQTADQASGAMSKPTGSDTPLTKVAKGAKKATEHEGSGSDGVKAKSDGDDRNTDADGSDAPSSKQKDGKTMVNEILDPDQPESERRSKVAVMEDKLFDVDLERMVLYPVFWKGVLLKVVRAEWFYSSSTDGSYAPISWDDHLSGDLDAAYDKARPWTRGEDAATDVKKPKDGKRSDAKQGSDEEEVVDKDDLVPLPSMENQGRILFEDAEVGRIFSEDLRGRFLSVLGGSIVVRGFDKAEAIARQKSSGSYLPFSLPWAADDEDASDDESGDQAGDAKQRRQEQGSTFGARSASKREGAARPGGKPPAGGGADESSPSKASGDDTDERKSFASRLWPSSDSLTRPAVALLRMVGYSRDDAAEEGKRRVKQKATEDEVDRQRNSNTAQGSGGGEKVDASKESDQPEIDEDLKDEPPELVLAIHGIGQQLTEDFDALDFVYDVERLRNVSNKQAADPAVRRLARGRRAQYIPICWRRALKFDEKPEGNDNFYTLDDVTNSAAIPIVRNVISKVVLDVPFYLSHHRQKMIESVTAELNRTYRLFCRRNPDFERKGGRVSIIGHSLGSALATDILSAQPTRVPPMHEVAEEDPDRLKENKHLHFNVKNLFFIGSPVGFFLYLDGGQLIARRGTLRSRAEAKEGEEDASWDAQGKYGCLATETVYNIYNPTDPVAFQLGATADRTYASMVKPIPIADAAGALLQALALPRLSVTRIFEKYGEHPFKGVGKIVWQAQRYEEGNDDDDEPGSEDGAADIDEIAASERRLQKERELGRKILDSSHFLKHVRKMKKLDEDAKKKREQADRESKEEGDEKDGDEGRGHDEQDGEADTDDGSDGGSKQALVDEPAPMATEVGTLQKRLQPRRTLDTAKKRGLSLQTAPSSPEAGPEDEGQHVDLDMLERGERRFRALNPHGCIDFMLAGSIGFSEYLDALSAHLQYWTHPDFATFVLTQLFADWSGGDNVTVVPDVEIPGKPGEGEDDEEQEEDEDDQEGEEDEDDEDSDEFEKE
ncbi:uncharacterized protein PFL1_02556 [Pseudozyma flocculosa PF-1]|uniref:Related to phosphatidic acid-preferring phospholipase A1 n=2 Tax=Pseudozyma flocculosa TaxID=84751 RepID=A0A5C3EZG2_9BASI|nr:uncharacterized protein PFL1_02556 [Pseudozyma flocculosa PF-1]EPQ29883.1 hypothetical protein PFL1_02556 [Pseudozyma flocculosa PF-1]SPO37185.1 related to phosphatidic acid-preferring phospholipase A1 [Pseudozyma flocculosa]